MIEDDYRGEEKVLLDQDWTTNVRGLILYATGKQHKKLGFTRRIIKIMRRIPDGIRTVILPQRDSEQLLNGFLLRLEEIRARTLQQCQYISLLN